MRRRCLCSPHERLVRASSLPCCARSECPPRLLPNDLQLPILRPRWKWSRGRLAVDGNEVEVEVEEARAECGSRSRTLTSLFDRQSRKAPTAFVHVFPSLTPPSSTNKK